MLSIPGLWEMPVTSVSLPHVSAEEAGMYEEHWATDKLDTVIQQSTRSQQQIQELWIGQALHLDQYS